MAEERSDTAHNLDGAALAAPADRAASPGASEATSTPESAEVIPGFRESLQRALKLFVRRHKGEYKLDFDWTLSRLERNMERPATLLDAIAVRMVCDAAYGSSKAWRELLDRLEGSVPQRMAVRTEVVDVRDVIREAYEGAKDDVEERAN